MPVGLEELERRMNITTRVRYFFGSRCYGLYMYMGLWTGMLMIYLNSIGIDSNWLKMEDLKPHVKSDIFFILGSGTSINSYNAAQWDDIQNGDSLGFNFWVLNDFVPTFYMYELPRNQSDSGKMIRNLELKLENYKNAVMFLKEGKLGKKSIRRLPQSLKEKSLVAFNPTVPAFRVDQLNRAILFQHKKLKKFKLKGNGILPLFSKRASLYSAIILGYLLNYRKIVLCGIDLNSSEYFFDEKRSELEQRGYEVPVAGSPETAHATNDSSLGDVTISELIKVLDKIILKPSEIELYVGSQNSKLYGDLPCYWNN